MYWRTGHCFGFPHGRFAMYAAGAKDLVMQILHAGRQRLLEQRPQLSHHSTRKALLTLRKNQIHVPRRKLEGCFPARHAHINVVDGLQSRRRYLEMLVVHLVHLAPAACSLTVPLMAKTASVAFHSTENSVKYADMSMVGLGADGHTLVPVEWCTSVPQVEGP